MLLYIHRWRGHKGVSLRRGRPPDANGRAGGAGAAEACAVITGITLDTGRDPSLSTHPPAPRHGRTHLPYHSPATHGNTPWTHGEGENKEVKGGGREGHERWLARGGGHEMRAGRSGRQLTLGHVRVMAPRADMIPATGLTGDAPPPSSLHISPKGSPQRP